MGSERRPVLKARGYDDVLALVPYRLGFHPSDSLVVLALEGPRRRLGFTMRVDLPPPQALEQVVHPAVAVLREQGSEEVLIVVYAGDDRLGRPLFEALRSACEAAGIGVADAFRADGRRWFSYTCEQPCCPARGTPYDVSSHPLAASCVLAGEVALGSREELRATVARVEGARRAAMQRAYDAVTGDLLAELGSRYRGRPALMRRATGEVRALVEGYLGSPRTLSDAEMARLSVLVAMIPVRDTAWLLMTHETAPAHLTLWQQVLRHAEPQFVPAVACLTAFAAWLAGRGALAWCAVERALEQDPAYSWAGLIAQTLEAGLSPRLWPPAGGMGLRDLVG